MSMMRRSTSTGKSSAIEEIAFPLVINVDETASAQMRSAIAEQFPEIVLDPIADYIVQTINAGT